MATYIIGDLHGCFNAFNALLDKCRFDPKTDRLYLCGDIVARGDNSLATLRQVKALSERGVLQTVLGNHDITLIATWLGVLPIKDKDKTAPILSAPDCDALLNWLRRQPFLLYPSNDSVLVHAGIPPIWTDEQAQGYADELQTLFCGDVDRLAKTLPVFYQKSPKDPSCQSGHLALIADYFTRMRLCDKKGRLDFDFKGAYDETLPKGLRAWFDWQGVCQRRIYFGHWAALAGKIDRPNAKNLDGGCVWGGKLLAYHLQNDKRIKVKCQ